MTLTPAADEAKEWLRRAVATTGSRDAALWERNVGERARVAAVHFALRTIVESEAPWWNVDAEYNRAAPDPKRWSDPQGDQRTPTLITPDLTIHRRGEFGEENNLLIVEFKNTYSNLEDDSKDAEKIAHWCTAYKYQIGAVVGFGPNGRRFAPQVRWFDGESWSAPTALRA